MSAIAQTPAQDLSSPRHNVKALLLRVAIVMTLLALLLWAYHWWRDGRFLEHTDDAYVGADTTVMSARVAGYIKQVMVSDNQSVQAGDVLVLLEDRDYRAVLKKSDAAIAAAEATLANLDATASLQAALIAQARAGVSSSSAEITRSRDDQQRYANLVQRQAVSKESAERASAEYQQALAQGQKAGATVDAAQRQLNVIETQKQQARATLEQASAERDIAALNLEYTTVRAPVDGVVGNRHARVGAYASQGQQLLAVVPAHGLYIDANFKEDQLAQMHNGDVATITADVLPKREFKGTLSSLAPATGAQFSVLPAENATGNFTKIVQRVPVRVLLSGADADLGALRPGLSVEVSIDTRGNSRSAQ